VCSADSILHPFYQKERDTGFHCHKAEWVSGAFCTYWLCSGSNIFIQPILKSNNQLVKKKCILGILRQYFHLAFLSFILPSHAATVQ
jgi:hypothetical protein